MTITTECPETGQSVTKKHISGIEVLIGADITRDIAMNVYFKAKEGLVAVLVEEEASETVEKLADALKSAQVKIIKINVNGISCDGCSEICPEYVRYILAVGGDLAAKIAYMISYKLNINYSQVLTSPDCGEVLYKKSPKQVFIDKNILLKCRNEQIAAAWGIVLSEPVKRFENYFFNKILNEDDCGGGNETKTRELSKNAELTDLALKLLEISSEKKRADAAEIMVSVLNGILKKQGFRERLPGEYKIICSLVLSVFYSNFLGSPAIDVLPPRAHNEIHALLEEEAGFDRENIIKRFDFFDLSGYFRIGYTLGEYRTDLLERLSGLDVHSAQRFWRRLYPDAGYWLKSALNSRTLLTALALAGEFSGGLLGYAAATGFTDLFLLKSVKPAV